MRNQITFNITDEQWGKANDYFKKNPNSIKLHRSDHRSSVSEFSSGYSFIKINDVVYAIGNKSHSIIGKGSFGRIKYAMNCEGDLFALKIQVPKNSNGKGLCITELQVCVDLIDLSRGYVTRGVNYDKKYYLALEYLGWPLETYLKTKIATGDITDSERLNIAIQCAVLVYKLHSGKLSNSETAYLHRDIKTENFVIDEEGNISLVDFGFAIKVEKQTLSIKTDKVIGSPLFLPSDIVYNQKYSNLTDLFALLRTFIIPEKYDAFAAMLDGGLIKEDNVKRADTIEDHEMILTEQLVISKKLLDLMSQKTTTDLPRYPAEVVAACLILAYCKFTKKYELVQQNQALAIKVIDAFENKITKKVLKNIIKLKKVQSDQKALLIDLSIQFPIYIKIIKLLNKKFDTILKSLKGSHQQDSKKYILAKRICNAYQATVLIAAAVFYESSIKLDKSLSHAVQTNFKNTLFKAKNDFIKKANGSHNKANNNSDNANHSRLFTDNEIELIQNATDSIFNLACS